MKLGYTLSSEDHGPRELVEQAKRAEAAGFHGLWSGSSPGPGDRVSMRRGRVYRNGNPTIEPYASTCDRSDCTLPRPITIPPGHC